MWRWTFLFVFGLGWEGEEDSERERDLADDGCEGFVVEETRVEICSRRNW